MKAALLVLVMLAVAGPASAQVGPAPYVALALGSSVDLATTLSALNSGRGQEGNPLLSHGGTPGLVAVKTASTVAVALLMRQIAQRGHPRAARVLGYTLGGVLTGVSYRNARVGR